MLTIGSHLSVSKGYYNMGKEALDIKANTFQFFTRNPRGSKAKEIDIDDVQKLIELAKINNFGTLLAHAPYTLNPCSSNEHTREFATMVMKDDLKRMELLPNSYYNFHPGSHTGLGVNEGIRLISNHLNSILKEKMTTIVLLETMAGKGTEIGSKFSELKAIIDNIELDGKIGICLDTCHVHDAGYDIVNNLENVLSEFDDTIGLDRLKAIHLNDSKNPFESHKDRHEKIGEGSIGLEAMIKIINHPKLKHLPYYLETPNDKKGYAREIELLRSCYN